MNTSCTEDANQPRAQIGKRAQRGQAVRAQHHVRHEPALEISVAESRKLLEQRNPQSRLETAADAQNSSTGGQVEQQKRRGMNTSRTSNSAEALLGDAEDGADLEKAAKERQLHQHGTGAEQGCPDEHRGRQGAVRAHARGHLSQRTESGLLERRDEVPRQLRERLACRRSVTRT